MRLCVTCKQHVTLKALSFCLESTLIILCLGPMSKENFYYRALVACTVGRLLRRGGVVCSLCGGSLCFHGCYPRHVKDGAGERHNGWVAQGYCGTCKKYPALIPDFVMPHKHYGVAVIEAAISEVEEDGGLRLSGCPADESTIRRWANQFKERGAQAVGWLLSILCSVYERHISTLELQNRSLLKQLARLACEIQVPKTSGAIGRVNIILTRHNLGFL